MKGAPRNSVPMKYNAVYALFATLLTYIPAPALHTCTCIVHTVRTPQAVYAHLGTLRSPACDGGSQQIKVANDSKSHSSYLGFPILYNYHHYDRTNYTRSRVARA